jgi:hypothetical protein
VKLFALIAASALVGCQCKKETPAVVMVPVPVATAPLTLDDTPPPTPAASGSFAIVGGHGSFKAEYQPAVRLLEMEDGARALKAISDDGFTLLFEPAPAAVKALQGGEVLVAKGMFARKVLAVQSEGEAVAVLTAPTSLGEVIKNGKVQAEVPLRFGPQGTDATPRAPVDELLRLLDVGTAHAQVKPSDPARDLYDLKDVAGKYVKPIAGVVFDGWKSHYSVTPGNGRLDIHLHLYREVGGFKGKIEGQGYLGDFDFSPDLEVEQGIVKKVQLNYKKLNGQMNITWTMGKETPGGYNEESKIKLPGALTIPLYKLLDGFPLFLEVSAAIIVQPFITGGMQIAHGGFRVNYDGSQGFTVREGALTPDGKMSGDAKLLEHGDLSAVAPMGMAFTLAAPRLELTLDPLKALREVTHGGLGKDVEEAINKVNKLGDELFKRIEDTELGQRLKKVKDAADMTKVPDAMKSNAMAYLQVSSTNASTHSGSSVITPCTRHDFTVIVSVGAAGQAFGQDAGKVRQNVLEKKIQVISPPGTKLCNY